MSAIEQSRKESERQHRFCSGLHPKQIVACVDLEDDAEEFVKCALDLGALHGATVHLLHVVDADPFMGGMESVPLVLSEQEMEEEVSSQMLALAGREHRDRVVVKSMVRKGKVDREIVAAAEELNADLIVVPSRPPSHFRRWHHTTAEKVVQWANCPVLVLQ